MSCCRVCHDTDEALEPQELKSDCADCQEEETE